MRWDLETNKELFYKVLLGDFLLFAVLVSFALLTSGCATDKSLRMLDARSEYENPAVLQSLMLKEGGLEGFKNAPIPVRTRSRVAAIWIHPHETASRDYFWGGWLSVVVEPDSWVLTKPGKLPFAPFTQEKPIEPKKKASIKVKPTG
jgi:hypothetical protein